jgi:hypothetical protein
LPVFARVTVWKADELTERSPKLIVDGEACSPGAGFSPEPKSGTLTGVFRSGLEIVSTPLSAEAALEGAKRMLTLRLIPGARTTGALAERRVKLAPET